MRAIRSTVVCWPLLLPCVLAAIGAPACSATPDGSEPLPASAPPNTGGSGGEGGVGTVGTGGTGAGGSPGSVTCDVEGATQPCYGGDPAQAGVGACVLGTQTCESSGELLLWGECTGWVGPAAEACDGIDNDCNGAQDEGCCVPAQEICDGLDNDCNGAVDEGCCVASPEVCDGIDNDCDGFVDDGAGCGAGSCAGGPSPCVELPVPAVQPLVSSCKQAFPPSAGLPCPIPDPGTQYYVSAASGNDANDGLTPATAWATLCHAVSAAPPGSTLRVAEGSYASAEVYVGKELTVKAGYDAAFSSWDPDAHPALFFGRLTLDHNAAVWGGFKMLANPLHATSWSYAHHTIAAGVLLRNYVEIVATSGSDPNVLNLYAILASACPGGVSVLRCNDIYVRSSAPQAFVTDAIALGNQALHAGHTVIDANRICQDGGFSATSVIAGCGTWAAMPASVLISNNMVEKAGGSGTGVHFYGCGQADLSVTVTNNTILSTGSGIEGYEGPPSMLSWKLTNNIIFSMSGGSSAVNVGSGAVQIVSSEGNLTFGFQSNGIFPAPLMSAGDDTSGAATAAAVFVDAGAGNFKLQPGGPGVGTGVNVYGLPGYGAVTRDLLQVPRPQAGAWDRGAYEP